MSGDDDSSYPQQLVDDIGSMTHPTDLIAALSREDYGYEDHLVYRLACRRLACLPGGVEAMYEAIWSLPKLKMRTAVLSALWAAEHQRHHSAFTAIDSDDSRFSTPISSEVAKTASRRLRDVLAESMVDNDRFLSVVQFAHHDLIFSFDDNEGPARLAALLGESSIGLTMPMLSQLEALIQEEEPELRYQQFLAAHPVLLDPLAAEVLDRHALGDDLITDYVIRRHDSRYIAVEIERPQDQIFTKGGDFTSIFTHAFGQVLDFIGWIDSNVAYASTKLPGVEAPTGMLVIGKRSTLSVAEEEKLRRFVANSRRIDVVTFDELLTAGQGLYSSLHYKAT